MKPSPNRNSTGLKNKIVRLYSPAECYATFILIFYRTSRNLDLIMKYRALNNPFSLCIPATTGLAHSSYILPFQDNPRP